MYIVIYDEITKKIESHILWPTGKTYPNPIPTGKKMVTVDALAADAEYYNESTGKAEPAPDAEKATNLRRKISDKYNLACHLAILTEFKINIQAVNLTKQRQTQLAELCSRAAEQTYPYKLKINSDDNGCGIYVYPADAAGLQTICTDGFNHIQTKLAENQMLKDALKTKPLTELQELI